VSRPAHEDERSALTTATVTSEVANFYPFLAGWGWFSRVGRHLYRVTQLKLHVIITHAFLRSLARLDLVPSKVGTFAPRPAAEDQEQGATVSPLAPR
jgi:hypothetical protein